MCSKWKRELVRQKPLTHGSLNGYVFTFNVKVFIWAYLVAQIDNEWGGLIVEVGQMSR